VKYNTFLPGDFVKAAFKDLGSSIFAYSHDSVCHVVRAPELMCSMVIAIPGVCKHFNNELIIMTYAGRLLYVRGSDKFTRL
jgi:hypothetical protein